MGGRGVHSCFACTHVAAEARAQTSLSFFPQDTSDFRERLKLTGKLSLNHYLVALVCRLFRLNAKPNVSGRWEKVKVPGDKSKKSHRDSQSLQTSHREVPQAREWNQQH